MLHCTCISGIYLQFVCDRDMKTDASRVRSLLTDFSAGVAQQMVFWGCDARHPTGNLLVRFGMVRLARDGAEGEGSSQYRAAWQGGLVAIHSFCAGWYPAESTGVVFIRHWKRLVACPGGEPQDPGHYQIVRTSPDEMLDLVRPLAGWVTEYEKWVVGRMGCDYRKACFRHTLRMPGVRPWLPPARASEWLEGFASDPAGVGRAKEWLAAAA